MSKWQVEGTVSVIPWDYIFFCNTAFLKSRSSSSIDIPPWKWNGRDIKWMKIWFYVYIYICPENTLLVNACHRIYPRLSTDRLLNLRQSRLKDLITHPATHGKLSNKSPPKNNLQKIYGFFAQSTWVYLIAERVKSRAMFDCKIQTQGTCLHWHRQNYTLITTWPCLL